MALDDAVIWSLSRLEHLDDARQQFTLLDAPTGGGKTTILKHTALQLAHWSRHVAVVCAGDSQAADLIEWFAASSRRFPLRLVTPSVLALPRDMRPFAVTPSSPQLAAPHGSIDVLTFATFLACPAQWFDSYDTVLVDDSELTSLADLLGKLHMPKQILLAADLGLWPLPVAVENMANGFGQLLAHVPAPLELLAQLPDTPSLHLAEAHRLPQDSIALLNPILWPFRPLPTTTSLMPSRIRCERPADGLLEVDRILNVLANGNTIGGLVLPPVSERAARPVADVIEAVAALLEGISGRWLGPAGGLPFRAENIGIVSSSPEVTAALRHLLQLRGFPQEWLAIDTPAAWGGRERDQMIVLDLIGESPPIAAFTTSPSEYRTAFTRHRSACVLVTRAGNDQLLQQHLERRAGNPLSHLDPSTQAGAMFLRLLTDLQERRHMITMLTGPYSYRYR